ncbi:DUF2975 domain-containing protein [Streptomyces sp. NP160]|uniref:DUF2975 domain-containing protein n=1 Tax=Streptomyces sp. NP160 TaxID=2586637 RepID=UPI0015D5CE2B|nr:DUF2975 domain-containing protein [Streptomyces sp. NP160]
MPLAHRLTRPLQVLLLALFAALAGAQVLLVVGLTQLAPVDSAELARFRWTVVVAALAGLVCLQVVLVATWRLLGLVRADRIFSDSALPWVDTIVAALAAVWVVLAAAVVPVFQFAQADDAPGLGGLHLLLLLVAAVPVLMMVVMRALLTQATRLRSDLEEVI